MSEPAMLSGHDIVCFSSIDWQFIWQGHQEIMSTLAANGNRILFVENTGVRTPSVRDLPRIRQRLRNWWRGTNGFRSERERLFIYSPLLLPFPYSPIVRRINRFLFLRSLRRWMRAAGFNQPIVWTFLPTPLVRETIPRLDPIVSVYYCIDDFASSSKAAQRITDSEQRLFAEVDLVFVTSEKLRERAARFSKSVHLFPFGVSFRKFEQVRESTEPPPADLAALARPIVGYIGGIHRWMDLQLLAQTAKAMPKTTFAMVGPLQTELGEAAGIPNLHFLGKRGHDEIPKYIKGFDVGIVPYVLSDYTANVYPTKLNEYLSMGLPVVATDLPEIRRFNEDHGPRVAVASDAPAFVRAIEAALQPASKQERDQRISVAKENSWDARIRRMSGLVEERLESARRRRDAWEVRLRRIYRRTRSGLAAALAIVLIAYLAFETSTPWVLAEPLRLSQPPVAADAIVVFAGGVGESGQAGGGYQERVKQAVDLYRGGFAPSMIFQSGYVFAFKEAEIMRDLALNLGVPSSAIVLEPSGANTYEAAEQVAAVLDKHGWRRILLVSSPYNMRRAMLVWKKRAPGLSVTPTPVMDTQFYTHDRGASLDQLRGLAHEYAAIAWYWWKGWL